ncbi:hypothetical protein [Clostridium culturomicium]|uniref:hypothetical protein n=1 Tax=Clostridium culturomicium TaxID=1499683 RepID=UPI00058F1ABB|nr:hypothetical protein [Clostridium culturomicium]
MWDIIDGIIIIPIMCVFTYGLIRQWEETILIAKTEGHSKKSLIVHLICCVFYALFLLGYMINVIISIFGHGAVFLTSEFTSVLCILSIAIFLVSRYGIISKS